jgi:nitroimidazol reductase NimA-like FMN-containing flavoprotein (pyridoxamine 5'-phosphate oxidase superfamily)
LCTTDKDNQPHITPMFFAFDEATNNFFVMTSSGSKKMQNLQANAKISLAIDIRDATNPFNNRGVMVQGTAMIEKCVKPLSEVYDKELTAASEAFQKKYPVLIREAKFPVNVEYEKFSEALIKIVPDKMTYWRGPNFITANFNKQKKSLSLV